jgi:hypothetical protein
MECSTSALLPVEEQPRSAILQSWAKNRLTRQMKRSIRAQIYTALRGEAVEEERTRTVRVLPCLSHGDQALAPPGYHHVASPRLQAAHFQLRPHVNAREFTADPL